MRLTAMRRCGSALAGCLILSATAFAGAAAAAGQGEITCYPAYGYQEGDHWAIPMRVWVHEPRALLDDWAAALAGHLGAHDRREQARFRARFRGFLADSESREAVVLRFADDPGQHDYRIQDAGGKTPKSDLNGVIEGRLLLTSAAAQGLLSRQGARGGWLSYSAAAPGFTGSGQVQLIPPVGLSVVSDIDDTIKVTEIPAGHKVVVENTFFRPFQAAFGMAALYRRWAGEGAAFHYVSGAPWQLYAPLADFLFSPGQGFPPGSVAMKNVWLNPLSIKTWEQLAELTGNANATYDQKLAQIGALMQHFPGRRFILVGDSGEQDPEVYRELARRFPKQVQEIRIRDVVDDRTLRPDRLAGMTIIPAATVQAPPRPAAGPD